MNAPAVVGVEPKLAKRFYEATVFLWGLSQLLERNPPPKAADTDRVPGEPAEKDFQCFVNKLAQICNSSRGGKTVTAISVLERPDAIIYVFGSNNRTDDQLNHTKEFLFSLLRKVGSSSEKDLENGQLQSEILHKIIKFNEEKLGAYIKSLNDVAPKCLEICSLDAANAPLKDDVEVLYSLARQETDFEKKAQSLIVRVQQLRQSPFGELLDFKLSKERNTVWNELHHVIGRIGAYQDAAQVIIGAPKQWPELFDRFEIQYVLSSTPEENPIKRSKTTVDELLGRFSSNAQEMANYRRMAAELSRYELSNLVEKKLQGKCELRVHAEMLVHDYLERTMDDWMNTEGRRDEDNTLRFYRNWRYIGSSKPTCLLCRLYFDLQEAGVKVRESHMNVYPAWRMPDVTENERVRLSRRRKDMNTMVAQMRERAIEMLKKKQGFGRVHDSSTMSSMPSFLSVSSRSSSSESVESSQSSQSTQSSQSSQSSMDSVATRLEKMHLDDDEHEDEDARCGSLYGNHPMSARSSEMDSLDYDGDGPNRQFEEFDGTISETRGIDWGIEDIDEDGTTDGGAQL